MKRFTGLFLVFIALLTFAQKSNFQETFSEYKIPYHRVKFDKIPFDTTETDIASQLATYCNLPQNEALKIKSRIKNRGVQHISFDHYMDGLPILHSGAKMHVFANGSVILQQFLLMTESYIKTTFNGATHYYVNEEGIQGVIAMVNDNVPKPRIEYRNINGTLMDYSNQFRYFRDTTVQGYVYRPNPIISAETKFGGDFQDNNDQTNPTLDAERVLVELPARFENDTFTLYHPNFTLKEIAPPYYNYSNSNDSGLFKFNRSQSEFEVINVFYHLTNFYDYIDSLGYISMVKHLGVDAHGLGDNDQSQFSPTNYTLQFGDGFVDDGEDSEVIIHEMTHSLSETASPESNNGNQRESMEEGQCDYISKSYSRSFSNYRVYDVFTWDGFNYEFGGWPGFNMNVSKVFPLDLKNYVDGDRDLWSTLLMCYFDNMGREAADSLVLEQMFYQYDGAKFTEILQVFMDIDSFLFDYRYEDAIRQCSNKRGFLLGVNDQVIESANHFIFNSYAFNQGIGDLIIRDDYKFDIELYNVNGQLLQSSQHISNFHISPLELNSGLYILLIRQNNVIYTEKIIR